MTDEPTRSDSSSDIESTGGEGKARRQCEGVKANGERCGGTALGEGWSIANLCTGHARAHAKRTGVELVRVGGEALGQAVGAARRSKRTPMDLLRAKMEADPETVAELAWKAMKEGRDVRAITAMLDRTYGDETGHVPEPHTFDELAKLDREQRRTLMRQLERDGFGPFTAPTH